MSSSCDLDCHDDVDSNGSEGASLSDSHSCDSETTVHVGGWCKSFNDKTGYGFLSTPKSTTDVFVHYSSIKGSAHGRRFLVTGEACRFKIDRDEQGRAIAVDVIGPLSRPDGSAPLICDATRRVTVVPRRDHKTHTTTTP